MTQNFCWIIQLGRSLYLTAEEHEGCDPFNWTEDYQKALKLCSMEQASQVLEAIKAYRSDLFPDCMPEAKVVEYFDEKRSAE